MTYENFPREVGNTAYYDPEKLYFYDYDKCPFCGGDVSEDAFDNEEYDPHGCNEIEVYRYCKHCGKKWTEVYSLASVFTDIQEGEEA